LAKTVKYLLKTKSYNFKTCRGLFQDNQPI
jgi:hypothetical protein